jgi:hypothetical protein
MKELEQIRLLKETERECEALGCQEVAKELRLKINELYQSSYKALNHQYCEEEARKIFELLQRITSGVYLKLLDIMNERAERIDSIK